MRRYRLLTLSTMVGAFAVASPASADRVFTVDGANAPGPARYDLVHVIEQGPRGADNCRQPPPKHPKNCKPVRSAHAPVR